MKVLTGVKGQNTRSSQEPADDKACQTVADVGVWDDRESPDRLDGWMVRDTFVIPFSVFRPGTQIP